MLNKIYKGYPKKSSQGPKNRPFYYGIKINKRWKYYRIIPHKNIKMLSSYRILRNGEFKLPRRIKILVFESHSDDAALSMGNFLLKLIRAGNQLYILNLFSCHLTVGGNLSRKEKKKIRDEEDRKFAKKIGASIRFLRLEFPYKKVNLRADESSGFMDIKNCTFGNPAQTDFEKVFQALNSEKPDMILLPHPFDLHQMHRDTANLALAAIAKLFPDQEDLRLLFYGRGLYFQRFGITTNIFNLLTKKEVKNKISLIRIFRSQIEPLETFLKTQLQVQNINRDNLDIALSDFLIDSIDKSGTQIKNNILLSKLRRPIPCERLVEFKL